MISKNLCGVQRKEERGNGMNLQELLTYVEELTFKTAMIGGYDKDEVDIQLDKICDEVEALVEAKDREIEALKNGAPVTISVPETAPEEENKEEEKEVEEPVQESTQDTEAYEAEIAELKQKLAETEQKLAEADARAAQAEKKAEEAQVRMAETKAAETAAAASVPQNTDEAYQQYMKNADLLCKQLASLETKHEEVVAEAKIEANQILAEAKAEAEQKVAGAGEQADQIVAEAKEKADQIVAGAKEECEELKKQKENALNSLHIMTEDIQKILQKVK